MSAVVPVCRASPRTRLGLRARRGPRAGVDGAASRAASPAAPARRTTSTSTSTGSRTTAWPNTWRRPAWSPSRSTTSASAAPTGSRTSSSSPPSSRARSTTSRSAPCCERLRDRRVGRRALSSSSASGTRWAACSLTVQQARHRTFDGVIVLGHGGDGLPAVLTADEKTISGPLDEATPAIIAAARTRFAQPPPRRTARAGARVVPRRRRPRRGAARVRRAADVTSLHVWAHVDDPQRHRRREGPHRSAGARRVRRPRSHRCVRALRGQVHGQPRRRALRPSADPRTATTRRRAGRDCGIAWPSGWTPLPGWREQPGTWAHVRER